MPVIYMDVANMKLISMHGMTVSCCINQTLICVNITVNGVFSFMQRRLHKQSRQTKKANESSLVIIFHSF